MPGTIRELESPGGGIRQWTYDTTWNVPNQYIDEREITTLYQIDSETGKVLQERVVVGQVDVQGNSESDDVVTGYTYTDASDNTLIGLMETVTDALGVVTRYEYNAKGQPTEITYAYGTDEEASVQRSYGSTTGYLLSETDELGRVTEYDYDTLGRVTSKTLPDPDGAGPLSSPVYEYGYNAAGQLASETDSLDNVTSYQYDSRGRRVKTTQPDPDGAGPLVSPVSETFYDAAGRTAAEIDPLARVAEYAYDDANRPTAVYRGAVTDDGTAAYDEPLGTWSDWAEGYAGQSRTATTVTGAASAKATWTFDHILAGRQYDLYVTWEPDPESAADAPFAVYAGDTLGTPLTTPLLDQTADPGASGTWRTFAGRTFRSLGAFATTASALIVQLGNNSAVAGKTVVADAVYLRLSTAVSQTAYDAAGRATSTTDALGNATSFQYDESGRETKVTQPDPDGAGPLSDPETDYVYNELGQLYQTIDPLDRVTTYEYDSLGRRSTVTQPDPDGTGPLSAPETSYGYDKLGQVTSVTDPLGNVTSYEYDRRGRKTKTTQPDPDGTGPLTAPEMESVYDDAGQLLESIDALDRVTSLDYDGLGRQTKLTQADPDGAGPLAAPETEYLYDAGGRLTQVIDPLDKTTSYQFDALGRMTKRTQPDPDGAGPLTAPETEYVYDAAGQLVETIDPLDHVTTLEYDTFGQQVKVTQPDPDGAGAQLAPWTAFIFDAAGRLMSQTDRLGHATTYAYDNLGRTTSQTDAEEGTTSFTYDAAGNRLTLTDPEDNTTTWEYDALDRMIEETNELSDTRYFTYNAGGFLTRQVDRLGRVRQFQYDQMGRNTAEIWYTDTTDADADQDRQRTIDFTYDAASQLLTAEDPDASYDYAYDALGRATSIVQSLFGLTPSVTLTQQFDAAGHRTQLARRVNGTDDFVNDYLFDPIGRTTRIEQHGLTGGKAVAPKRVDFAYDAAGRTTDLTRYANLAGTQLVAHTDYGYDFAGRLTDLTHFRGGTTFADYQYTFDAGNRMTQFVSSADGTAAYTNDDTGQLMTADYDYQADESYVYDSNGNRTNGGYTVGANNRMTADGTYAYLYDAEGNRTRRFVDANANGFLDSGDTDITEYAWDQRDRLTTVTHRASYGVAADWVVTYAYDYANRWVHKELDSDGDSTAEFRQIFAYDGNQIVLDFRREGSEDLTIGHLRERYLWGPAVDQILAEEAVDGGTADMVLWTLTDHLNTVRDLAKYDLITDTTTVVNHLVYDAFGQVTAETNAAIDSLFLFTARAFDEDSGLQNNLNRWFNPPTARWMSDDPISADLNLYRYCGNNPVLFIDPSGLMESHTHGRPVDVGGGVVVSVHSESGVPNAGNVHIQIGGTKYYVDAQTGQLFQRAADGSRILAPARLQSMVNGNRQVQRNVANAMRRVLETGGFAEWMVQAGVVAFALYGYDAYVAQGAETGSGLAVKYSLCNLLNVLDTDKGLPTKRVFDLLRLGIVYHVVVNERNGRYYFDVWHTENQWSWTLPGDHPVAVTDLAECPAPCRGRNGVRKSI